MQVITAGALKKCKHSLFLYAFIYGAVRNIGSTDITQYKRVEKYVVDNQRYTLKWI